MDFEQTTIKTNKPMAPILREIKESQSKPLETSAFFRTEVKLLIWFSIEILIVVAACIIWNPHPSIAIAAIGAPTYLLERWYKRNTDKYECKNKRDVQLQNGTQEK